MDVGKLPRDSRIDVCRLKENKGAYFARAVALAATSTRYHAVIDADDWVEKHWLSTLLAQRASIVQHGSRFVERDGHDSYVKEWKNSRKAVTSQLTHYTSHTGLYKTNVLRRVGGYSPNFKVGYDSFLCAILRLTEDVAIVDEPLYHRYQHMNSLCNARETRIRGPYREANRAVLQKAYKEAYTQRNNINAIKRTALKLTPAHLWDEVEAYAKTVR